MDLLLEIKGIAGYERRIVHKTVEVLVECDFVGYHKFIAQSFLIECLQVLKSLNDKIPRSEGVKRQHPQGSNLADVAF